TVAQRQNDALLCYSPSGPLTREELDNVSEHFDTLAVTGILPNKDVRVDDTWKVPNAVAQALCLFEGLVANELTGKLVAVQMGAAVVEVTGTAKGIELGAQATVKVNATGRFDMLKKRLVRLEWKQADARDQGPASPAVNVETTTVVEREAI